MFMAYANEVQLQLTHKTTKVPPESSKKQGGNKSLPDLCVVWFL